ncbi:MAG: DNA starvation/stationary phase protection protein [Candidatus Dependentiae bacterium]|nr:DNA starvation/stationary phase protection protein [Candidatus Dependentiae bacterium]
MNKTFFLSLGCALTISTTLFCLNNEEKRVDQPMGAALELGKNLSEKPTFNNQGSTMASNKAAIMPNIGISQPNLEKVGALLNSLLADEFVLYIKSLNYHWNVRDPYFSSMHQLFKDLYEKQLNFSDDVAERARALGVVALGTAQEFIKHSQLKEEAGKVPTTKEMLKNLLADHETIIRSLRIDAEKCLEHEDIGTNNFLIEMLNKHEKIAWMLRANFE